MKHTPSPGGAPVVMRQGEHWHTLNVSALAEELRAAGFVELPLTRAFVLGRVKWDRRKTFVNVSARGKVRIGGDTPEPAEELLEALARQSEEVAP
jgi:hypothetical protein